jgi:hypothetical protein
MALWLLVLGGVGCRREPKGCGIADGAFTFGCCSIGQGRVRSGASMRPPGEPLGFTPWSAWGQTVGGDEGSASWAWSDHPRAPLRGVRGFAERWSCEGGACRPAPVREADAARSSRARSRPRCRARGASVEDGRATGRGSHGLWRGLPGAIGATDCRVRRGDDRRGAMPPGVGRRLPRHSTRKPD